MPSVDRENDKNEEVRREYDSFGGGHTMWEPAINTITNYIVATRKIKETGQITPVFP